MSEHSIAIANGSRLARVVLDGQRIDGALVGLTVRMSPRQVPQVCLDLDISDVDIALRRARVQIPERSRELLLALGWAPPEGDT